MGALYPYMQEALQLHPSFNTGGVSVKNDPERLFQRGLREQFDFLLRKHRSWEGGRVEILAFASILDNCSEKTRKLLINVILLHREIGQILRNNGDMVGKFLAYIASGDIQRSLETEDLDKTVEKVLLFCQLNAK